MVSVNPALFTNSRIDRVTTYTYTDRGDVATETDAEGNVISYEYDGNRNMVKKTTLDGDTLYAYDALDRLVSTTTPDGKSETFTYNGEGQIVSSTDKGGHTTTYELDANSNITKTTDALGNSALFEYDAMGNLTKTSLHRVDTQDNVDEWEITTYEYDGRSLVTREVDALGNVTTYTYDGNGNLLTKTDPDGYVTTHAYNNLDMVTKINYNNGKQASYQYNAVGDLVEMTDWTGTTTFEVDLLSRITKTTDTKGKVVEYAYDATGNQTSIDYPDGTAVTKTYDLLGQLATVVEADGRTTSYTYDGMGRVSHMAYPDGWTEDYHYDAIGQLTAVEDTDPTKQDMKQQKHVYEYDDCGNMVYEYMRGNGTGEATVENTYTYDALHRLVTVHEDYGNDNRSYTYDSLGNLTYETAQGNKSVDYKLNNLNQITTSSDDGWKTSTAYTYDGRGNLTQETYTKNKKVTAVGSYIYDETNKMVSGTNEAGEKSNYIYNGLGALVENQWIIAKNAYGYHSVTADGHELTYGTATNKNSVVIEQFVVDYTSATFEPLMEYEVNGFDDRYVYGNDRLSVDVKGVTTSSGNLIENGDHIRLYYHMDYLGTADYLTSPVSQKVVSWTHYNEWGEITHNAVLKCGQRELDMVKRYATHDYDSVLGMYYAKARFYDAEMRRFTAMDPVKGFVSDPATLLQYLYVKANPINYVDPNGEWGLLAALAGGGTMAAGGGFLAALGAAVSAVLPVVAVVAVVVVAVVAVKTVIDHTTSTKPRPTPSTPAKPATSNATTTTTPPRTTTPSTSTTKPNTSTSTTLTPQQKQQVETFPAPVPAAPNVETFPAPEPALPNIFADPIPEPIIPTYEYIPALEERPILVLPFPLEAREYFQTYECDGEASEGEKTDQEDANDNGEKGPDVDYPQDETTPPAKDGNGGDLKIRDLGIIHQLEKRFILI